MMRLIPFAVFVVLVLSSLMLIERGPVAQENLPMRLAALQVYSGPLDAVAFSPDGGRLVSGGRDHQVRLWSAATGENVSTFNAHEHWVASVAFSADGEWIASGGRDNAVRLTRISDGSSEILNYHRGDVTSLTFSPDGQLIASAGRDGMVRLTDIASGEEVTAFEHFGGPAWDVAFHPNGEILATSAEDGTVWLWGLLTETPWLAMLPGHESAVPALAFSEDGTRLLSGGLDGLVQLWDVSEAGAADTLSPSMTLRGHLAPVMGVGFAAGGRLAISASLDGTVRLWDMAGALEPGAELGMIRGNGAPLTHLALSPDQTLAASVGTDGVLSLWDVGEETLQTLVNAGREATFAQAPEQAPPGEQFSLVEPNPASIRPEPTATPVVPPPSEAATVAPLLPTAVPLRPTNAPTLAPAQATSKPPTATPYVQPTRVPPTPAPPTPPQMLSDDPMLSIPSVGIRSEIKTFYLDGVSWAIDPWEPLVGHLQGTAWLDKTGNMALGAHSEYPDGRPGLFNNLYNVSVGAEIIVSEGGTERRYRVVEVRTVDYQDLSVIYPTSHNRLTLITCDIPSLVPGTNHYQDRLVVIADAIS